MKLLWDAVGTEFGGRHELYERNYAGGWEDIRAQTLTGAERGGDLAAMEALVDQCMADYDENGWVGETGSMRAIEPQGNRVKRTGGFACHCEERSDVAISIAVRNGMGIAFSLAMTGKSEASDDPHAFHPVSGPVQPCFGPWVSPTYPDDKFCQSGKGSTHRTCGSWRK